MRITQTVAKVVLFVLALLALPLILTGITMADFASDCHAGGGTVTTGWSDWGMTTCHYDAQDLADTQRIMDYAG